MTHKVNKQVYRHEFKRKQAFMFSYLTDSKIPNYLIWFGVMLLFSGPMMALCLAREDAVEGWREMLGPKEVEVAKEDAPER